jgi:hypothetical protein
VPRGRHRRAARQGSGLVRAWRAARTASSSSDLPPPRRRARLERSASMTRCLRYAVRVVGVRVLGSWGRGHRIVQQGSTATCLDAGGPGCTLRDGGLRLRTLVDGLPLDGMQEVWGSNPLSSTLGYRQNCRCCADRTAVVSVAAWCDIPVPSGGGDLILVWLARSGRRGRLGGVAGRAWVDVCWRLPGCQASGW